MGLDSPTGHVFAPGSQCTSMEPGAKSPDQAKTGTSKKSARLGNVDFIRTPSVRLLAQRMRSNWTQGLGVFPCHGDEFVDRGRGAPPVAGAYHFDEQPVENCDNQC